MMKTVFALLALFAGASALDLSQEDAKNRPVSKVITLMKDMQAQLEKEADSDQEVYDSMACWCETNDKEKTRSIQEAESRQADLSAAIEEGTASSARLNAEISATEKENAKNQQALDTATALRQKQLAEFNGEEKDMLQSVSALKSAVVVLGKHHEAMLQQKSGAEFMASAAEEDAMIDVAVLMKDLMRKHASLLGEVVTPSQKKVIAAFAQDQQAPSAGSYAPQGGEVFGILKNMKETFEANLVASQKEESENQKAFGDMKAAKQSEIAAGSEQLRTKTNQLGSTDEKLANDKGDLVDTTNSLGADQNFLAMLKEKCAMFDQEFEMRQKTRQEEIQAVSKAMAVLSGDDAHDLFTKTFNPAFVQKAAARNSKRRTQVAELLRATAKKVQDPKLSTLAMHARLDAFGKVKESLEAMITKLEKEKEDEIAHKDWCIDEMNTNERNTELKDRDKEWMVAKIEDLTSTIDTLTTAIQALKGEIAEMQVQMKRAGEDREKANKEFQVTVADQRATQKLLQQALNVLKGFYDKKAALVQAASVQAQPAGPPPPAGFKSYEKNAASGGVMGMIQQIINDAKAMEADAIQGEEDAQAAYEDFVKDTNASIEEKSRDITNKSETRAQAEADKTESDTNLEGILSELQMLANESADLHSACDFVLKNFDIRQSSRDQEVEALKQSIAILSGASFGR
jgi:outer membrane murein-binding lipoprotein Lpp